MNEFTFDKLRKTPPGFDPAICPAPSPYPQKVVLYGHVTADPYQVFSAPGTYSGTFYAHGTYAGTFLAVPIFYGTVTAPGVYQGTLCTNEFGVEVPYGWTGAMVAGTYHDASGTIATVPRQFSIVNATTNVNVTAFHTSATPLAQVATPGIASEFHATAPIPPYYIVYPYVWVTLTCATQGATIYYNLTVQGSSGPWLTYSSMLDLKYTYPIQLRVVARKAGMEDSEITGATLTSPY